MQRNTMKKFAKPIFAMKIHQRFNQELCTITYVHLSYFQTNTLLESNYKSFSMPHIQNLVKSYNVMNGERE